MTPAPNTVIRCGRLSRGRSRPANRLTLLLPLTASGVVAEDDLVRALAALLRYAPYAIDPKRFRGVLTDALTVLALKEPPMP